VIDLFAPGIQTVVEAAARKGVKLDFRLVPLSRFTDEEVAEVVGAELGQIVRSVVCVAPRPGGRVVPVMCLVSARNRLDLELVAAVTGEPTVRETSGWEARVLFGHFAGGTPPFGHGHDVRTVMDQSLGRYQWLWAAAGADSTVIRIAPETLRVLSNAVVAPVAQPSWMRRMGTRAISLPAPHLRIRGTERPRRPRAEDGP
jgi:prolyl-tRNA editing enzyme YbaK/EbsC (Cys-tRNA(Pro) deacylase)